MKSLYSVAVLHENEKGVTTIIVEPCFVLADTEKNAEILAGRKLLQKYLAKLEEVKVIVVPFNPVR